MTPEELRDVCLALPQAEESFPFGFETSVFKTTGNGKIFALSALDAQPLSVSLKVDPQESLSLQAQYSRITPGYHLNKKHWITIVLDRTGTEADGTPVDLVVPDELVGQLIFDSHALVRPAIARRKNP